MKRTGIILFVILTAALVLSINKDAFSGQSAKVPILLYHHMLRADEFEGDNAFIIRVEDFEEQLKYLSENGYSTITLDALNDFLYNKKPLPPKSVMIHFDDGYYSNILYAYPLLKKYGFCATIFLITKDAGDERKDMSDKGALITVQDMEDTEDVFEYASHTHRLHVSENGKSSLLLASEDTIIADLEKSFEFVENTAAFAYPYGQFNNNTIEAVKQTGIEMAFAISRGYITPNSAPYKLNRFTVYRDTSLTQFKKILQGAR